MRNVMIIPAVAGVLALLLSSGPVAAQGRGRGGNGGGQCNGTGQRLRDGSGAGKQVRGQGKGQGQRRGGGTGICPYGNPGGLRNGTGPNPNCPLKK